MATKEINPKLEALLEYGPIVAFFVAYKFLQDHTFTVFGTDYAGFIAVTGGFVVVMLITTYRR